MPVSEVGAENRRFPNRESKPSAQHPHRTHDTTDQWREVVQWLGRFWRKVSLSGRPPRPTSKLRKWRLVHEMLVIIMVSLGTWSGHGISMLVSRYKNKGLVNSWFFQVWRIGSVLVHVSQLSNSRVRWIWRIGSVLVHVSQLWWSSMFWKRVCVRVSSELWFAFISSTLSPNTKWSQIGIWCSGTRKCSQRYEIDHFCQGFFQPCKLRNSLLIQ